jgi:hypothetical protein
MPDNEPAPVTEDNLAKINGKILVEETEEKGNSSPSVSVKTSMSLSQRAMDSMSSMVVRSIIAVNDEPIRLPTKNRKAPLSVATTAVNFRGFVQKSGPLFVFQDAVESTLMWDDWPWTTLWMGIWAVVSLYPRLFLCVPPAIALTIMCNTYFIRFPLTHEDRNKAPCDALRASFNVPDMLRDEPRAPPIEPRPVKEGELKYFMHMRDIQNMMRLIIDGYDNISPVVKYLNWSDVPRTLRIFQICIVALIAAYFVAPLIPWRLAAFFGGELVLVAHHPWLKPAMEAVKKQSRDSPSRFKSLQRQHRFKQRLIDMLDEDRLPEFVWQRGWKDVEMFENQRYQPGRRSVSSDLNWSSRHLRADERRPWTRGIDGYSVDITAPSDFPLRADDVDYQLDEGYEWIEGENWRIDWGGAWSSVGVDDHGYVYTDASWCHPAPYAYGTDESAPKSPFYWSQDEDENQSTDMDSDLSALAVTRRRRWLRRAVRVNNSGSSKCGVMPMGT